MHFSHFTALPDLIIRGPSHIPLDLRHRQTHSVARRRTYIFTFLHAYLLLGAHMYLSVFQCVWSIRVSVYVYECVSVARHPRHLINYPPRPEWFIAILPCMFSHNTVCIPTNHVYIICNIIIHNIRVYMCTHTPTLLTRYCVVERLHCNYCSRLSQPRKLL